MGVVTQMPRVTVFTLHSVAETARILNVGRGVVESMIAAGRLEVRDPAPGHRPRVTGASILRVTGAPSPETPVEGGESWADLRRRVLGRCAREYRGT